MRLRQPIWPRFLPTRIILAAARLGPVGRMRKAPGTWGSLAGLLYQLLIFHHLGLVATLLLGMAGLLLAVGFCGEAEFRLGRRDPGEIVLDEFVVIPLCFVGWPGVASVLPSWSSPWAVYLAGFALFRLYDITKPFGIAKLQDLEGGWGVVLDDLAAAVATCLTLHAVAALLLYLQHR